MKYVEGEGFVLTKGDTWKRKLLVLQLVNAQGAWMDEITVEKSSVFTEHDIQKLMNIPENQHYRILERESTETIIEIIN